MRLDNTEASLIKVDNAGSKFGLINCDQFMLQLVIKERSGSESISFEPQAELEQVKGNEPIAEARIPHKEVANLSIEPILVFSSPGENDPLNMQLDSMHFIHFMKSGEQRFIDVNGGRASIRIEASRRGLSLQCAEPIRAGNIEQVSNQGMLFDGLPCGKVRGIFRLSDKVILHANLKKNAHCKLGDAIIRFDSSRFLSTSSLVLARSGATATQEVHLIGVY